MRKDPDYKDYDPTDFAGADDLKKARNRQAKVTADDLKADVRWLMSQRRGRRLVRWMLVQAGVWRLSYSTNALAMAFAEGCRNVGLTLVNLLNEACPEHYATMLTEEENERITNPDNA